MVKYWQEKWICEARNLLILAKIKSSNIIKLNSNCVNNYCELLPYSSSQSEFE